MSAVTLKFVWNRQQFLNTVRGIAHDALDQHVKQDAHQTWLAVAPVGRSTARHEAGTLRDSWFAFVVDSGRFVKLIFGAMAPYAIYVELGTGRMAPRAPLRRTASMITGYLTEYLRLEAWRRGFRVK